MEVSALTHPVAGSHGRSPLLRLQSDERLITLIRRGSHGAFEEVVRRYQSRLLSFCRHMLGSREDAEDVLQEVFAAAFNAIQADDRPINVRPWLYRIARNRSLNHLRRVQAIGVDSMDIHFAEHGTTTADKVDSREAFRELITDVGDLPETQRTALLLREIDALSYEQIAEAMETTIPSVKSLLVRARVSLAEAAEARRLSCDHVRMELGEIAEGLRRRATPPVRRHVRDCDRCATFRTELRTTSKALAMMLPVGPLLLAKKVLLLHLGLSFGAGGAGGTAASGGAALGATAGSAALGTASTGGLISAGIGAVTTKAAVGLAAAALVTAGAVEIERSPHRAQPQAVAQAQAQAPAAAPVVPSALPTPAPAPKHRTAAASKDPKAAAEKPVAEAVEEPVPTPVAATPPVAVDPGRTQTDSGTTSLPVALPDAPTTTAVPVTPPAPVVTAPVVTTTAAPVPATTPPVNDPAVTTLPLPPEPPPATTPPGSTPLPPLPTEPPVKPTPPPVSGGVEIPAPPAPVTPTP